MKNIGYDKKRIAKNTFYLYLRMFLSMIVSLYTARIVFNTLGVVDYGIKNVVGGVIAMFGFLRGAMATGTQRFFNYEMGRNNFIELKKIFSSSLAIHIIIAFIILVFSETIGLWFVNTKLVIPPDRLIAANWVYQFTVFSTMITVIQVPYTASIIANERMNIYGYMGILEVVLRLLMVYLLVLGSFDKLKLYSVLSFCVTMIVTFIYRQYCTSKFEECHFIIVKDKILYKKILQFSGWNLFGSVSGLIMNQGQNILLNIFFGPAINAARAVSVNVNSSLRQFVSGFMTATNPQIIKSYAAERNDDYMNIIFLSARISFFLLTIVALPVLIQTEYILNLWLKNPPDYSVIFCRLTLLDSLIVSISYPLMTSAQATGNIKVYQSFVGGILLLNLPLSYLFLKLYGNPIVVYFVTISLSIIATFGRLYILKKLINIDVKRFIFDVIFRCWIIFIIIFFPLNLFINSFEESILKLLWGTLIIIIISLTSIILLGTSKEEKRYLFKLIKRRKQR